MSDGSRRFTDREVALVLKKASEIEEGTGSGVSGGLSLDDLKDIAREVGISPAAIAQAVAGIDRGQSKVTTSVLSGAPAGHKAVHAVQGELNEAALNRLIHIVDERMESAGAISEALGSIRWTSSDRFSSTQVAITPQNGETSIQVTEKVLPRWKRVFHLLPAAWGTIIAAGVSASASGSESTITLIALAIGAGLGLGAGRAAWSLLAQRSERRVARLAADLSREAYNASKAGMVTTPAVSAPAVAAGAPTPAAIAAPSATLADDAGS